MIRLEKQEKGLLRKRTIVESIKTSGQLRDELLNVFVDLRNGMIDLNEAAEINNTAGKIINLFRAETEFYALIKKAPDGKFITG